MNIMTPDDFVSRLRAAVVEENTKLYSQLFANTPAADASDEYWRRALSLFNDLSADQQKVFLEVVRQVAADTTSNILGVIDGVNALDGASGPFELRSSESSTNLSGDLQSLFLVQEERAAKK